jgi:gluconokinase
MSTYPKSPKEMTSGMMWFPRLVDKIRLHARGELAEDYHENLGGGMDQRCVGFLRVAYPELRARVLQGGSDEEILEWCFATGRRLDEMDLLVWNSFVSKFGWNDQVTKRLQELKEKFGVLHRTDIVTIPDLLDLDEQRRN